MRARGAVVHGIKRLFGLEQQRRGGDHASYGVLGATKTRTISRRPPPDASFSPPPKEAPGGGRH